MSEDEQPLSTSERFCYSVFNGADYLIKNIIGKYMFLFYTTTFAIPPIWIAFGQPLVKILDVVTDPLVGEWSDRTRSKMGKRALGAVWIYHLGHCLPHELDADRCHVLGSHADGSIHICLFLDL